VSPEDDALDHIPESIELTRAEAARLPDAMDEAVDALPAGAVCQQLQAAKRSLIGKLSPWLGDLSDGEEDE
jgi:hypothetical protein